LPSFDIDVEQAMTAADALLKNAIDSGTMPADVQNPWDGQPYVPSDEFKQKLTNVKRFPAHYSLCWGALSTARSSALTLSETVIRKFSRSCC
jgi:hypothetical protein